MTIQVYQLATMATFVIMALAFWKIENKYVRIAIAVTAFILFAVSPFRHHQEGVASLERNVSKFEDVPSKVAVEQESFAHKQQREMRDLKNQSGDMKNEIHN